MKFFALPNRPLALLTLTMTALFCLSAATGCALYDGLSSESAEGNPDTTSGEDVKSAQDATSAQDAANDAGVDADSATKDADAESDAGPTRCSWAHKCGAGVCGEFENECHYPREISVGGDHACAIFTDGSIRCWGRNNRGQLGRWTPREFSPQPAVVDFGQTDLAPVSVAAGGRHNCAILENSNRQEVYCWGENSEGQLGKDAPERAMRPSKLSLEGDFSAPRFKAIVAGAEHSCLISQADGFVTCWGQNNKEQLGNSHYTPERHGPQRWVRDFSVGNQIYLKAGALTTTHAHHTCAIDHTDELKCWGNNQRGQLGKEGGEDKQRAFADDVAWDLTGVSQPPKILDFGTGQAHTCALVKTATSPDLYCWGDNSAHQSNPTLSAPGAYSATPTRVLIEGLIAPISAVATGEAFTCIVAEDDNWVRCFGDDTRAQTGETGDPASKIKKKIQKNTGGALTGVTAIDAGASHACVLRQNQGAPPEVWCWGDNTYGQLGVLHARSNDNCAASDHCSKKAFLVRF